jgi:hypothetical protein
LATLAVALAAVLSAPFVAASFAGAKPAALPVIRSNHQK